MFLKKKLFEILPLGESSYFVTFDRSGASTSKNVRRTLVHVKPFGAGQFTTLEKEGFLSWTRLPKKPWYYLMRQIVNTVELSDSIWNLLTSVVQEAKFHLLASSCRVISIACLLEMIMSVNTLGKMFDL